MDKCRVVLAAGARRHVGVARARPVRVLADRCHPTAIAWSNSARTTDSRASLRRGDQAARPRGRRPPRSTRGRRRPAPDTTARTCTPRSGPSSRPTIPARSHLMRGWFADSRPAIGDGSRRSPPHRRPARVRGRSRGLRAMAPGRPRRRHRALPRHRGARPRLRRLAALAGTRSHAPLVRIHPRAWPRGHRRRRGGERTRPGAPRGRFRDASAGARALRGARQGRLPPAELLAMPAEVESLHALVASLNDELSTQRDEIREQEQRDRGLPPEHELEDHPPGAGDRLPAASTRLTTRAGGVHGRLASRADPRTEHPRQLRDHPAAVPRRPRRVPRVVSVRRARGGRGASPRPRDRATPPSRSEASSAASTSPTSRRARPSTSRRPHGAVLDFVDRHPRRLADVRRSGTRCCSMTSTAVRSTSPRASATASSRSRMTPR